VLTGYERISTTYLAVLTQYRNATDKCFVTAYNLLFAT